VNLLLSESLFTQPHQSSPQKSEEKFKAKVQSAFKVSSTFPILTTKGNRIKAAFKCVVEFQLKFFLGMKNRLCL
jgi:hypothetical protein